MYAKKYSDKVALAAAQNINERDFWLNNLAGELNRSCFPRDFTGEISASGTRNQGNMQTLEFELPGTVITKLLQLSSNVDIKLHMILVTGLVILLNKYSFENSNDILVGSPVLKQEVQQEFINTLLVFRNRLFPGMTFKTLLLQVREVIVAATENQNYPLPLLCDQLDLPPRGHDFPLFDVALLLENIHEKNYLGDIRYNVLFSFCRTPSSMRAAVEYNADYYHVGTLKQVSRHFSTVLDQALDNIDIKLADIEILSGREKTKLLMEFNATARKYPLEKTVVELFIEQVERTPDQIALAGVHETHEKHKKKYNMSYLSYMSYKELNKKSNQLAHLLKEKGAGPDRIVAIMVERSLGMIIGILGILKAGSAYLPIDPDYPQDRIRYMLTDSNVNILVENSDVIGDLKSRQELFVLNFEHLNFEFVSNFEIRISDLNASNLAYIIYTSGSTGRPKGVMVEHRNLTAYLHAFYNEFEIMSKDTVLQQASFSFDAFVEEMYPVLLKGGKLALPAKHVILDIHLLSIFITRHQVSIISTSPLLLNEINKHEGFDSIHTFISGGDVLKPGYVNNLLKKGSVYNTYGPTESTVCATYYHYRGQPGPAGAPIPIGKPIANYQVYILDKTRRFLPPGVPGELCVSGPGITRGYLNRPGLTAERFLSISNKSYRSYRTYISKKIYKTGDLARWLQDGNLEFLGRIDNQVNIRGFRVELGEIESCLCRHPLVREAVVIEKTGDIGDHFLCAYYILAPGVEGKPDTRELKEHLLGMLPDYMVPSFYLELACFPFTSSGKLDRTALPEMELEVTGRYVPPRDRIEEKLVSIWSEILGIDPAAIGIDTDFFDLGGNSLKTISMVSRVQSQLKAHVKLTRVFKNPTIRALAPQVKEAIGTEVKMMAIEPVEQQEYYPLSSAQKRLYILQQLEPGLTVYNMPMVLELEGNLDKQQLENAFNQLINRHEILRTYFIMKDGEPVQRIHKRAEFEIQCYDLQVTGAGDTCKWDGSQPAAALISSFLRPFDLSRAPLLRVGLVELAKHRHLLMVDLHHIVSDGMSHQLLVKDFAGFYQGENLHSLELQYKDYAWWQRGEQVREIWDRQEQYWLGQLQGQLPVLNLPTDYPRPGFQQFEGNVTGFELEAAGTAGLKALARQEEVTMHMLVLAVTYVWLAKLCSQEDIIVGIPTAGRRQVELETIIGVFVNTLAVRSFPSGEKTFKAFLQEIKTTLLEAYDNQEYPFEDLVERVAKHRDAARSPIFDMIFMLEENSSSPETTEMAQVPGLTLKPFDFEGHTSKFDISLSGMVADDRLVLLVEYCTKLFKETSIQRFINYFKKIIAAIIENPARKISGIEIITPGEKQKILMEFNNTRQDYPGNQLIHQLFQQQAGQTPDRTALVNRIHITYEELNRKSNQLAHGLRDKGVGPDTIVGVMMERSVEMIIGILGILKSGGAYLPIDPEYPEERINYMLTDSGAKILLKDSELTPETFKTCPKGTPSHPHPPPAPATCLAYIIYTSGSTGMPKGVAVNHSSVVNLLYTLENRYPLGCSDAYLFKTSFLFDVSVTELFGWCLQGGRLVILKPGGEKDPRVIIDTIEAGGVTHINFVPSMFNVFVDSLDEGNINRLSGIKYIFLAGEALLPAVVEKFRQFHTPICLENLYGPTEATVYAAGYSLQQWENGPIPIGIPLSNMQVYIMDTRGGLQPVGITGELCIAGKGTARGYLNRPELTFKKFCLRRPGGRFLKKLPPWTPRKNFLLMTPGKRSYSHMSYTSYTSYIYHTGDLARWLPAGNIEFLGRMDQQVKIRGFRVELGEIQEHLLRYPGAAEAVVMDWTREDQQEKGERYLCAYIVPVNEKEEITISRVREFLSQKLPAYMLPSHVVLLDRIPFTPGGKVNRQALPLPGAAAPDQEYVAPGTTLEKTIAETWEKMLNREKIGIHDNIFDLGGTSLDIIRIAQQLNQVFTKDIPVVTMFRYTTIHSLARFIDGKEAGAGDEEVSAVVERSKHHRLQQLKKRRGITNG